MTEKRKVFKGFPISGGIVLGQTRVVPTGSHAVTEVVVPASALQNEADALERAVAKTVAELRSLRDSADKKMGNAVAQIFDAQLMIASDFEFLKQVKSDIFSRRRNAGFIYDRLVRRTVVPLKRSRDPYMRQTAQDIESVAARVLSNINEGESCELRFPPNTILVGKTFGPNDILSYRQRKGIGFVVGEGGTDSHMALIARALMLPAVVIPNAIAKIPSNVRVVVDGVDGRVIINPNDSEWAEYQRLKKKHGPALIARVRRLQEIPPITMDGQPVGVAANISLPGPADDIIAGKNIPVGLFRTEFLYLAAGAYPDEATQYATYRAMAEKFSRSSVVIRIFDLGYDKVAEDSDWPEEINPALGWRGIRAALEMTDAFKTQIKAILRASTRRNLKILLPMISTMSEIERAHRLLGQVKLELRRAGVAFDEDIQLGIMVEVPSAAMIADALVPKVDFVSIGTNDLTQYTMAADRTNQRLAGLYNPLHPAVLTLINMTVVACKKHGKPVSICGEVAGDVLALPLFIGMGVDSLSMSPGRLFDLCRAVRRIDSRLVRHLVGPIISSDSSQSVRRKLEHYRAELEGKRVSV